MSSYPDAALRRNRERDSWKFTSSGSWLHGKGSGEILEDWLCHAETLTFDSV